MSTLTLGRRFALPVISLLAAATLVAQRAPIQLVQGTQVGKTMFEPGDTRKGGTGQPVDGIEGSSREMLNVHIHAHLSIFIKGEQVAVPYNIGILPQGIYWLHTHDATGIIHVESPDSRPYTLGQFFDIWGRTLSATEVAGQTGAVRVFVDGKPRAGDPRSIVLTAHGQITLEVGDPVVTPPVYVFPNGL